jgi:hypothetical protein
VHKGQEKVEKIIHDCTNDLKEKVTLKDLTVLKYYLNAFVDQYVLSMEVELVKNN